MLKILTSTPDTAEDNNICPHVISKPLTDIPLAKLSLPFHCWLLVTSCMYHAPYFPYSMFHCHPLVLKSTGRR